MNDPALGLFNIFGDISFGHSRSNKTGQFQPVSLLECAGLYLDGIGFDAFQLHPVKHGVVFRSVDLKERTFKFDLERP